MTDISNSRVYLISTQIYSWKWSVQLDFLLEFQTSFHLGSLCVKKFEHFYQKFKEFIFGDEEPAILFSIHIWKLQQTITIFIFFSELESHLLK